MDPNFFHKLKILVIFKIGPRYVSVIKRAQDKYCFKIEYLGELHIWAQDMFQLLKLGSTSRDPNFFFSET